MEIKMNCEIHPDVELIPHIFTDLGIVQHHSSILEERLTPRLVYWLYDCPICTQWHWDKVFEEYGSYFGYWDEV
tara:strand:- start:87 stop:308 length:222 start_codon:yes stop_codon:yes gene_type:complete